MEKVHQVVVGVQADDMDQKGNAPVQTCLEMAHEGKMTPLPGVNCIHTVKKVSTTTSTTALHLPATLQSTTIPPTTATASQQPTTEPLAIVTTTTRSTSSQEPTTTNNLLDVRNAFDQQVDSDVVTYDVDLNDDVIVKPVEEPDVDAVDDDEAVDVADEDKERVKPGVGGKLLEVEDYPVVGRDFDLATKLVRLNPRQAFDY